VGNISPNKLVKAFWRKSIYNSLFAPSAFCIIEDGGDLPWNNFYLHRLDGEVIVIPSTFPQVPNKEQIFEGKILDCIAMAIEPTGMRRLMMISLPYWRIPCTAKLKNGITIKMMLLTTLLKKKFCIFFIHD